MRVCPPALIVKQEATLLRNRVLCTTICARFAPRQPLRMTLRFLDEVATLLAEIRSGWEEISPTRSYWCQSGMPEMPTNTVHADIVSLSDRHYELLLTWNAGTRPFGCLSKIDEALHADGAHAVRR